MKNDGAPSELARSAREFAGFVLRRWYAIAVVAVGGLLGFVDLVLDGWTRTVTERAGDDIVIRQVQVFEVPDLAWVAIACTALLGAAFAAFHAVRQQRDDAPFTKEPVELTAVLGSIDPSTNVSATYQRVEADGTNITVRVKTHRS